MSNRIKKLCFLLSGLLVLAISPAISFAQGSLTGKVTDSSTGEGLPGTNIVAIGEKGFTRGVTTNADGVYLFKSLPAGSYVVTVTYVGYNDYRSESFQISDGSTTWDISLEAGVSLNPVIVSASKFQEKVNEAPASIEVVDPTEIRNISTASATDLIKGAKSVDVAQQGIAAQTVATRGFNNIFSGSLLVLTDNRIASIPSLRANALHFLQVTNDDIEQIEMVLGPGSALYGPNVNSGIMHMLTKSPLNHQGVDVSLFAGERSFVKGQARISQKIGSNIGIKVSAQYLTANDFQLADNNQYRANEINARNAYLARPTASQDPEVAARIGIRDYNVSKFAADSRLDIKLAEDFRVILSGGYNSANNIDLTGLGAGQAKDWALFYTQARVIKGGLFAQVYMNGTNSGDSYIIPTGNKIIDKSQLLVGQVQYNQEIGKAKLTYGADFLQTTPESDGTINGAYEDIDQITELGVYGQAKYALSEKFDLLASFRMDKHSELSDPVFSPRAGIVFKPAPNHTFRLTYNRSFGTPSSNNLWLDLQAGTVPIPLPGLPFSYQVRAQGVPASGFNFGGTPTAPTWYAPLLRNPSTGDYLPLDYTSQAAWPVLGALLQGAMTQALTNIYMAGGVPQANALALAQARTASIATTPGNIALNMMMLNTANGSFTPVSSVTNIAKMKPTIYNTFEVGYKGILNDKMLFTVDAYYTKAYDFVGPLINETPNVFLNGASLASYLTTFLTSVPEIAAMPSDQRSAVIGQVLNGPNATTPGALQLAAIPFGVVSPAESFNKNAMILTYRNFGEIDFFGLDLGFEYLLNDEIRLLGNYSRISAGEWLDLDGNPDLDIYLNAPKNKGSLGVNYNNRKMGLASTLRGRYVQGFKIESGIYNTKNSSGTHVPIDSYMLVDLNLGYEIRAVKGLRASLSVTNLLNNEMPQFAGTPNIGRLAMAGVSYSF